jgi:hypothetical protein
LRISQALAGLRNAQQTPARIAHIATEAQAGRIEVPSSALDVADYIKSANYLAHVRWALSLGKARALEELGGSIAAKTYRDLRRGKDEQDAATALDRQQRNRRIRAESDRLRAQNPRLTQHAIAKRVAQVERLSVKQLTRIIDR